MIILALETSTRLGSVALIENNKILAYEESVEQRSHSEFLNLFVDHCLKVAKVNLPQVDCFAVGMGPGSFTGIRIAGNVGKSFAYSQAKPMVAVDSLSLLAYPVKGSPYNLVTMINAYKNMVYLAIYDGLTLEIKTPPLVVRVQDLAQYIQVESLIIGDGYDVYSEYFPKELKKLILRNSNVSDFPNAKTLGIMAVERARNLKTFEWNLFKPLYLRASEAEENLNGIVFKSLKKPLDSL